MLTPTYLVMVYGSFHLCQRFQIRHFWSWKSFEKLRSLLAGFYVTGEGVGFASNAYFIHSFASKVGPGCHRKMAIVKLVRSLMDGLITLVVRLATGFINLHQFGLGSSGFTFPLFYYSGRGPRASMGRGHTKG